MKQGVQLAIVTAMLATLGGCFGYWAAQRGDGPDDAAMPERAVQEASAAKPAPVAPIFTNETHEAAPPATAAAAKPAAASKKRKILYYRNPMGLPDTSSVPKKDPMGMDYIPVYEGEDDAESSSGLKISTEKVQKLGVRTEKAHRKAVDIVVRAAGRIEPDERRIYVIAPKFEGYVERLHVNTTGQGIVAGQPLFDAYSRELLAAQREYAIVMQSIQPLIGVDREAASDMRQLAESSLTRLNSLGISEKQARSQSRSGRARHNLTFRSPVAGVVMEKKVLQGMRFMPGDTLYQVADLSTVWVMADVFEQDIGQVKPGATARVKINAYPDKIFEGKVNYIYPALRPETRTLQMRIELANPGQLLKPGMYAQVELKIAGRSDAVSVPLSAVIDSGTRRVVLVRAGEGRFEPREVRLGARGVEYVEVLEGVREGEEVVVSANFLIDAESNLRAALRSFSADAATKSGAAGHKAVGTVEETMVEEGMASISHGPVESLKWPDMTMEFKVANASLFKELLPGAVVSFEFVERQPGEWVITSVQPGKKTAKAPAAKPHSAR